MVRAGSGEWRASTSAEVRSRPGAPRPSARTPSPLTVSSYNLRPLRGLLHRARSYSGSRSVQGAQRAPAGGPPAAAPGLSETPGGPGRPTSTDTASRCRALGEATERGCQAPGGHRAGPLRRAPRRPAAFSAVPLPEESSLFPFRDCSRTVESMPHIQIHSRLRHRHSLLQILLTALVLARPAWPSRLAWAF